MLQEYNLFAKVSFDAIMQYRGGERKAQRESAISASRVNAAELATG